MSEAAFEPSTEEWRRLLGELGYSLQHRQSTWHECLLSGRGEAWLGHGSTPQAALEQCLKAAFPSHAARELAHAELRRRVAGQVRETCVEAAESPIPPQPTETVASTESAAMATGPADSVVASRSPAPRVEARAARRQVPPDLDLRFDDIESAMDSAIEEASLLEPERQRLLLLSWIARARELQTRAAGTGGSHARTYRIAQRCNRLAKIWWPGSVYALVLDAVPALCAADIPDCEAETLSNWADVAEAAEAALAAREDAGGEGVDDHGWHDADALVPRHAHPDVLMNEVVAALEKSSGPILRPRDGLEVPMHRPGDAGARDLPPADALVLARKLRWLRGATRDWELWGAAIGRVRLLAWQMPKAQAEPLRRLLDPTLRPALGWARELGYDPDKRRKQKERKELVSAPPEAGWDEVRLGAWIRRAIDLEDFMPTERLATLLEPVAEAVLRMDSVQFSERRTHRVRLAAVQRNLRKETPPEEPPAASADVEDEVAAQEQSPQERLVQLVRPHTQGRSALFVTNRNDPDAARALRDLFGFQEVDSCEGKPASLSAKAQSIDRGSYDFVLAATGFLAHTADGLLGSAARRAGVPYVRVNRGRPLSCALHLARELGLRRANDAATTP